MMFEKIFQFVSFIGAAQGVILSLVFLSGRNLSQTRKLMGVFILFFSLGLLEPYIESNLTHYPFFQWLLVILVMGNFLYGPLIYLFVYYFIHQEQTFRRVQCLHFLPFGIGLVISIIPELSGVNGKSGLADLLVFEGLIVQILTYNILAIKMLRKYRNQQESGKYYQLKDIRWLEHFLVFLTSIYVLSFTISHLIMLGMEVNRFYLLVQLTITLSIYLLSYKSMLIPEIFSLKTGTDLSKNGMKKYQRSGLKPDEAVLYLEQLKQYMKERKAYLNPNVTIEQMAQDMSISRHHLTQVINEHFKKNFYGFVNQYRVEEVKRMITDKKYNHFSLSALGLEAGFKSKTTFNANFKKETGLTPSEWKMQQKNRSRLSG